MSDNWTELLTQYQSLYDTVWQDHRGDLYRFVGLLDASDDYYYLLVDLETGLPSLLSCVLDLELRAHRVEDPGES